MKFPALALCVLTALPNLTFAYDVCFTNDSGATFTLNVKAFRSGCTASNPGVFAVIGTFQPSQALCEGSSLVGIQGTCFGVPDEDQVQMNLVSARIDADNKATCGLQAWNLIGASFDDGLQGSTELIVSSDVPVFTKTTFTPVPCN